ncbi:MAG: TIGR03915 family putative DNA repair protein [Clostridiales bacterium]|nr:TIGR03915 family putative DNA repair protein [Clostridiales bacterium]
MRCPLYGGSCRKYETVRRCPGCPVWAEAKAARQARWAQPAHAKAPLAQEARQGQDQAWQESQAYDEARGTSMQMKAQLAHMQEPGFARTATMQQDAVIYHYDGSLPGFFCCVYESVYRRELPSAIIPWKDAQPTLMQTKEIVTDHDKARRVRRSIPDKIGEDALDLIETVFLSCLDQKELRCLRFLLLGYREGRKTLHMLSHSDVAPLLNAERHLLREAHLLKGFIRFSDYGGVLAANITPKNFILPFIAHHFCARYAEEDFVIYDKNHKAGLIYENHKRSVVYLEEMPFPPADEAEERYRALWKNFYHTIAIEARENPKCRMTLMPKRYWENMTEMEELL